MLSAYEKPVLNGYLAGSTPSKTARRSEGSQLTERPRSDTVDAVLSPVSFRTRYLPGSGVVSSPVSFRVRCGYARPAGPFGRGPLANRVRVPGPLLPGGPGDRPPADRRGVRRGEPGGAGAGTDGERQITARTGHRRLSSAGSPTTTASCPGSRRRRSTRHPAPASAASTAHRNTAVPTSRTAPSRRTARSPR